MDNYIDPLGDVTFVATFTRLNVTYKIFSKKHLPIVGLLVKDIKIQDIFSKSKTSYG